MLCGQCIFFDYLGRCHNGNTRRVEGPYFAKGCKYAEPKHKEQPKTTNTMNEEKTPTTQVCKTCGRELPIEQFATNVKSKNGHLHVCKECNFKARSESRKALTEKRQKRAMEIIEAHTRNSPRSEMVRPNGKPLVETPSSDPELLRVRRELREALTPTHPKDEDIAKMVHYASSKLLIAELTKRGWKGTLTYVMTANLNCE